MTASIADTGVDWWLYLPKHHSRAHPWGPLAEEYFLARSRKAAAWPPAVCTERLGPDHRPNPVSTRPATWSPHHWPWTTMRPRMGTFHSTD